MSLRPTELNVSVFGATPALPRSRADQFAFKFHNPLSTVSIKRPWGLVVSAHESFNDLKPAPKVGKKAMIQVLHDEPKFSEMFMAYILRRNARVEADLVDQLFNSTEKRLARILLLMANFGQEGEVPKTVITPVSQETLADIIGTTRPRVSTFMNKFRKLGFIEYNGELKVHSSLLNVVLHGNPALSGKNK